jgi:hypothetical protein
MSVNLKKSKIFAFLVFMVLLNVSICYYQLFFLISFLFNFKNGTINGTSLAYFMN